MDGGVVTYNHRNHIGLVGNKNNHKIGRRKSNENSTDNDSFICIRNADVQHVHAWLLYEKKEEMKTPM